MLKQILQISERGLALIFLVLGYPNDSSYTTKHCVPLSAGLWHQKVSPSCFPSLPSQARRVKISWLVLRVSLFTLVQGAESGGCSCGSEGAADLVLALAAHRNRMGR